jgi:hypothetical protein
MIAFSVDCWKVDVMNVARQLACSATVLLLCLAVSCGRGNGSLPIAPDQHAAALALHLWETDCLGQPGSIEVHTRRGAENEIIAQVCTRSARGLKAVYFDIAYDPLILAPVSGEFSAALAGTSGQLLQLAVLDEPGKVYMGAVQAKYDQMKGFSGDGLLAELHFKPVVAGAGANAAPARKVRTAPVSSASKAALWFDESSSKLNWLYAVQGDYNQNGVVSISDLTPLGQYFGATSATAGVPFGTVDARSVVDGNSDGVISIDDLTPIGINYGADAMGGYAIYKAPTTNGYPASNNEPSHIPLTDVQLTPEITPQGQRLRYSYTLTNPTANEFYWVRPLDGQNNAGTPSNIAGGNPTQQTSLHFYYYEVPGSGTKADPFQVVAGQTYGINLEDTATNNLSTNPDTTFFLNSDSLSYMSISAARFAVPNPLAGNFSGYFMIWATYQNVAAANQLYFRAVEPQLIPDALLTADVKLGKAPLTVNFDASGSTSPNGAIVKYEFEMNGDLNDPAWVDNGPNPQAQHTFTTGMDYGISLRVTDDHGLKGLAQTRVNVYDWRIDTVDAGQPPANVVGKYCSLAWIAGKPGISYYDETAGRLCYAYYDGAAWHATIVDQSGNAGLWSSLVALDDRPAIAYCDVLTDDLKYARASTAAPTGPVDWAIHSLDGPDSVGAGISMRVKRLPAAGFSVPGIAYVNATDNTINYAQALIPGPTSAADWAVYAVAPADDFSRPALAYVYDASLYPNEVNYPAIAYTDDNSFVLKYAQATAPDLAGGAAWTVVDVDSGTPTGAGACLQFFRYSGPNIASFDAGSGALRFSGSALSIPDAVSPWASFAVPGVGPPVTADYCSMLYGYTGLVYVYHDTTYSVLNVLRGEDLNHPPNRWLHYAVDLSPGVGEYCSVVETGGPSFGVAYFDSTNGDLKYAQHNWLW